MAAKSKAKPVANNRKVSRAPRTAASSKVKPVAKAATANVEQSKNVVSKINPKAWLAKYQGLSVAEYSATKGNSLYVCNVAHLEANSVPSQLVFSVGSGSSLQAVKVAQTWLPQDITSQASRKRLLASSDFRKAVQGDMHRGAILRIIPSSIALEVLATPQAQDALEKLRALMNEARRVAAEKPEDEKTQESPAQSFVQTLNTQFLQGRLGASDVIASLKARQKDLKKADVDYLARKCTSNKVKTWALKLRPVA